MRVCTTPEVCEAKDCELSSWSNWGTCDKTCGSGVKARSRNIVQMPEHGGNPCEPGAMTEVMACNEKSCKGCKDGDWADWEAWSACGASCGGGTSTRIRKLAQQPNACGLPPIGRD